MVNKKKMLSPKTTIWWVPASGVANYNAITVAEINAGVNISCAIQTGYTLNPTDPDTDDSKSICENSNAQNPTFDNYEASLPIFRGIIGETTGVFYQTYQLFKKPDAKGYLVRRIGKLNTAPVTTADTVSVFGVSSDVPADITSDSGGPIGMTVPFLPTGELNNFYKLLA
jgi:hypothetical protein